jgi:hypothetical protein
MDDADGAHKAHRAPASGRKAEKKAAKTKGTSGQGNDPRAHAIRNVNRTRRKVVHALDKCARGKREETGV